jgi:hypothetical protein
MAWRASGTVELPESDLNELEVEVDEDDTSDHKDFVVGVIKEAFKTKQLRPGVYNVRVSGHSNKTEDDNADNLNININRTTT